MGNRNTAVLVKQKTLQIEAKIVKIATLNGNHVESLFKSFFVQFQSQNFDPKTTRASSTNKDTVKNDCPHELNADIRKTSIRNDTTSFEKMCTFLVNSYTFCTSHMKTRYPPSLKLKHRMPIEFRIKIRQKNASTAVKIKNQWMCQFRTRSRANFGSIWTHFGVISKPIWEPKLPLQTMPKHY